MPSGAVFESRVILPHSPMLKTCAWSVWREGLREFPDNQALKDRLARDGEELETYINDQLDPNKRVDTDLKPLWSADEEAKN